MSQKNPLQLNDFISYDCDKEKFIVQEYIIPIPAMEFSFDEIKGISPENKILYKDFMKKILKSGDIGKLESTLAYRKGQGERKNGNGDGREYKRTIESKLMKKIGINNYFNIFLTGNFTLSLKHKKAKP